MEGLASSEATRENIEREDTEVAGWQVLYQKIEWGLIQKLGFSEGEESQLSTGKKKKKKGRRWESQRAEETEEGLKLSSWTVGKQVKWEASGWLGCVKKNPPEGGDGDYTLTTGCLLWHFLQQTRRFRGNQRQHTVGFTPGWVFAMWRWESASGWREFSIMLRMLRNQGTMESKKRSLVD